RVLSLLAVSARAAPPALPSLPTRRSADLAPVQARKHRSKWSGSSAANTRPKVSWLGIPCGRLRNVENHPCLALPKSDTSTQLSRSEEHTSELQSREKLVCRLLLEKKQVKA